MMGCQRRHKVITDLHRLKVLQLMNDDPSALVKLRCVFQTIHADIVSINMDRLFNSCCIAFTPHCKLFRIKMILMRMREYHVFQLIKLQVVLKHMHVGVLWKINHKVIVDQNL